MRYSHVQKLRYGERHRMKGKNNERKKERNEGRTPAAVRNTD
jgi:hypothetical protein